MNVYDFDKTIYYGDSTADFYLFCLKRHKKILTLAPSLLGAFLKFYVFKKGTKTDFKEKMYRFLTYCDTEKDVNDFWKEYIGNIKPFYLEQKKDDDVIISASPEFLLKPVCKRLKIKNLMASKVDMHSGKYSGVNCHGKEKDVNDFWKEYIGNIKPFYLEQKKDDDVIISASPEFLLKPVCKRLKIKNLMASKVDMHSGKYSGVNCHGKEKVKRFYEAFPDGKIDNFYSDSYSDSPLAEIAEKAFMVDGDKVEGWIFFK